MSSTKLIEDPLSIFLFLIAAISLFFIVIGMEYPDTDVGWGMRVLFMACLFSAIVRRVWSKSERADWKMRRALRSGQRGF